MPVTSLTVLFGKNALTLRSDFSVSVIQGGEQPFANASSLVNEHSQSKYATFEPNMWLMDGSYHFIGSNQIGYWSTEQSDASGNFSTPPLLRFVFNNVYSTDGLTLYFSEATGDYADDITIAFYDSASSLIRTDNYIPTSTTFATGQAVSNFARIDITFNGTNKAYRFARLINIDFDTTVRWSGEELRNAKLIEQVNPLCTELPISELSFSVFSTNANFSIINPSNEYASLEHNEPIEAYESIDGVSVFLGRFYLDNWESLSEHEARFTTLDAITLLEDSIFYCPSPNFDNGVDHLIDRILKTRPLLFTNSASDSFSTAVTSLSWNVDCAGENRLLIVTLWLEASNTMTGATYGGVAMTELGMVTNSNPRIRVFYLINPPIGTDAISLTWTTARKCAGMAASFFNVDQASPLGALFSNVGTTGTSSSVTVTDANDKSILFENLFIYNGNNTTIPTYSPTGEWNELNELYMRQETYQDTGAGKAGANQLNYKFRNGDYAMTASSIANSTNFINLAFAIRPANPAPDIDYELDDSFLDKMLWYSSNSRGMLPSMTRREALQHVCFAIGAYVTCARSRHVRILPFPTIEPTGTFDHILGATQKSLLSPVRLRKAMTALDIAANRYEWSTLTDAQTLYSQTLGIGIHFITVEFGSLLGWNDTSSTTVHKVISTGKWWMLVQITSSGTFTVTASYLVRRITDQKFLVNDAVPNNTPANVITIPDAYLLTPDNSVVAKTDFVLSAIQRVFVYFLRRIVQKTKLFGLNVKAGDTAQVSAQGDNIYGLIERAEFDLTGGFISNLEIIGVTNKTVQTTKYNDTDSIITYVDGFTGTALDAGCYQGDIHQSTNGNGGSAKFSFVGTGFRFIYRQTTGQGSVKIFIDNVEIATINQNGTTTYQVEWASALLQNTWHEIEVQKVGTSNVVNLDAIEIDRL